MDNQPRGAFSLSSVVLQYLTWDIVRSPDNMNASFKPASAYDLGARLRGHAGMLRKKWLQDPDWPRP